jgi:uncharacterized protein (TIGR03067 family)
MKLQGMIVVLTALVLVAADDTKGDAKKDQEKLQGAWKFVSGVTNGQPVPAEGLKGATFTIKEDKYHFEQGEEKEDGTFKLDPSKKPATIDLKIESGKDQGKTQLGIYKFDGDKLTFCFAMAGDKERPKEFATKADTKMLLYGLQKEKAEK